MKRRDKEDEGKGRQDKIKRTDIGYRTERKSATDT